MFQVLKSHAHTWNKQVATNIMLFWNSSVKVHWVIVSGFFRGITWCFERLSQGLLWIILAEELVVETANNLSWKNSRSANSSNVSHQEDPLLGYKVSLTKCSHNFHKVRTAAEQFLSLADEINCQKGNRSVFTSNSICQTNSPSLFFPISKW